MGGWGNPSCFPPFFPPFVSGPVPWLRSEYITPLFPPSLPPFSPFLTWVLGGSIGKKEGRLALLLLVVVVVLLVLLLL